MAQATTKKLQKAQAVTVDSEEGKKYETVPVKLNNVRMLKGYKYYSPVNVLITFESDKRMKGLKMINKEALKNDGVSQSFTAIVNNGFDLMLYMSNAIKYEEMNDSSKKILDNFVKNYKPIKQKSKKQK